MYSYFVFPNLDVKIGEGCDSSVWERMRVPNVRCQLCIFRPLWDTADYSSHYSGLERCASSCAELWEARVPRDLMLVSVCRHNHVNGDIETALPDGEKSVKKLLFVQLGCGNAGGGEELLSIAFYSRLLSLAPRSIKEIGLNWSRYQSSRSPCWGKAGSGRGFLLSMPPFHPFVFRVGASVTSYALSLPRLAVRFHMRDGFHSSVHYLSAWSSLSQTCSSCREMPHDGSQRREKATPINGCH